MSELLKDLIDIPERAGADDYVLRLTEGVSPDHVAATIDAYVVTPALAEAFDKALDLVAASLKDGQSRAAFLAGSFGSGKSHFMAVLYALLGHEPAARAKAELAPVVTRHDAAIGGKKILRLAYHFLSANTMEEVLFSGYVDEIRRLHPDCTLPAVHQSDGLLDDADHLRAQMGDEKFFTGLGGATKSSDPWANVLGGSWDAESYDAARAASATDENRTRLVSGLAGSYFRAYLNSSSYVAFEDGLAVVTAHAKGLGYDAIVQFLDEAILWLAFNVRNRELFARESQKLTKLVEAGGTARAIPVVSFVARQMDLRRYFVDAGGAGAEMAAVDQALQHQASRFLPIELGDDNLQYVAEKRLLQPVDAAARGRIDFAFHNLDRSPAIWDVLLDGINADPSHRGADQQSFRRTYPFSPALVSALRTLASAMQRDRTALKVMQKLLVKGRDHLTVDDVIPVGDIFDDVVDGQNAVSKEMAGRIGNARKLYQTKLRPALLREHKLAEADVESLPVGHQFRADERLAKTLVLSAVAPDVPALKDLTAGRLAALNHGSIVSPIRGAEVSVVLGKVKRWAVDVPEIHIGEGTDPTIRVQVSDVEYQSVIDRARSEDKHGRRREAVKKLVWDALGLDDVTPDAFGVQRQTRVWRGSKREIELVFGNVRKAEDLTDELFRSGAATWRFIVDYPFDEEGRGTDDDVKRVEELRAKDVTAHTLVWLPHHLTRQLQDELGELVILDWLLGPGDRFQQHADHMAEADRPQARLLLENRQRNLRERLARAVQECYGAAALTPGTVDVDPNHQRVLESLDPGFAPQSPVGTDLGAAFGNLVDQAFMSLFPAHPLFVPSDREVRPAEIKTALEAIEAARQDPTGRVFVEPTRRDAVKRVLNPLRLGQMGETHLLFDASQNDWVRQFAIALGRDQLSETDAVTVERVRGWIAAIAPPYGLRPEISDLVIRAWAIVKDRAWYRHGMLVPTPEPGSAAFANDIELRPEPLPARGDWDTVVARAGALFAFVGNANLTGAAVAELVEKVGADAAALAPAAGTLVDRLNVAASSLGVPADASGRVATAVAAKEFAVATRATRDRVAFIEKLAAVTFPTTDQAVARSLKSADAVSASIAAFDWSRLAPLVEAERSGGARAGEAKLILDRLRAAFGYDELTAGLAAALKTAEQEAWTFATTTPLLKTPVDPRVTRPAKATGRRVVRSRAELQIALDELSAFADEHEGAAITVEWRAE